MPQPVHNAIVTPHNDPHLCLKPLFFSLPLVGVCAAATPVQAASGAALVLRFDDNKPAAQWREVAEIFEAVGGRCSFAVNPAGLNEEQWAALRDLASRGHEIMDHTAQHAVFKLRLDSAAEAEAYRTADFFDHAEGGLVLCRPELDLAHPGNVRVKASMTAGVLRSDDPRFLSAQSFSRKFYVPSTGALYGLGKAAAVPSPTSATSGRRTVRNTLTSAARLPRS